MKDKITDVLTTKKTVFGFYVADLFGIVLMLIPFFISLFGFPGTEPRIPFLPEWLPFNQKEITIRILPNMGTGLLVATVFYYGAFVARYDVFRTENIIETLVSSLRTLLNCWRIASLLAIIIDSRETFFGLDTYSLLLFAIIFSWIGMNTLAGYSLDSLYLAGN